LIYALTLSYSFTIIIICSISVDDIDTITIFGLIVKQSRKISNGSTRWAVRGKTSTCPSYLGKQKFSFPFTFKKWGAEKNVPDLSIWTNRNAGRL